MAISDKETKFKDETYNEIWFMLVDMVQERGIPIWFLKDSKAIDDSIEGIVDKLYFFVENVKQDKEIIRQFKEGKEFDKVIEK